MGRARHTIAIGEHMRAPGRSACREAPASRPRCFRSLTGLAAADDFVALLADISGRRCRRDCGASAASCSTPCWTAISISAASASPSPPTRTCCTRSATFFAAMGAEIVDGGGLHRALTAAGRGAGRARRHRRSAGFRGRAAAAEAELLVTHSHGRQACGAAWRSPARDAAFPIFDRLGAMHRCTVGYRGTRDLDLRSGQHRCSPACMPTRRNISPPP